MNKEDFDLFWKDVLKSDRKKDVVIKRKGRGSTLCFP